eukprot:m.91490 g.91490  ORF g.91490 m.91490 type:complete len:88 (-) comp11942_c0_seq1:107-370(-)
MEGLSTDQPKWIATRLMLESSASDGGLSCSISVGTTIPSAPSGRNGFWTLAREIRNWVMKMTPKMVQQIPTTRCHLTFVMAGMRSVS